MNYLKYFTELNLDDINDINQEFISDPKKRSAQKMLADNLIEIVHGKDGLSEAKKITEYFFSENYNDLSEQNILDLSESFPSIEANKSITESSINLGKFLVDNNVFNSMSEMRRMFDQGALYINGIRVTDSQTLLSKELFLNGKFMIIRLGSKKYYLTILK